MQLVYSTAPADWESIRSYQILIIFKQHYLTSGPSQVLPLRAGVDLGVMPMKGYSTLSRSLYGIQTAYSKLR